MAKRTTLDQSWILLTYTFAFIGATRDAIDRSAAHQWFGLVADAIFAAVFICMWIYHLIGTIRWLLTTPVARR